MTLPLGETLRGSAPHYQVRRNSLTGAWKIVDLWHPWFSSAVLDTEIPDDAECVMILPDAAFEELVKEAERLGVLKKALSYMDEDEREFSANRIEDLEFENEKLRGEQKNIEALSEGFRLKSKAMDQILKIVAVESME